MSIKMKRVYIYRPLENFYCRQDDKYKYMVIEAPKKRYRQIFKCLRKNINKYKYHPDKQTMCKNHMFVDRSKEMKMHLNSAYRISVKFH